MSLLDAIVPPALPSRARAVDGLHFTEPSYRGDEDRTYTSTSLSCGLLSIALLVLVRQYTFAHAGMYQEGSSRSDSRPLSVDAFLVM